MKQGLPSFEAGLFEQGTKELHDRFTNSSTTENDLLLGMPFLLQVKNKIKDMWNIKSTSLISSTEFMNVFS